MLAHKAYMLFWIIMGIVTLTPIYTLLYLIWRNTRG